MRFVAVRGSQMGVPMTNIHWWSHKIQRAHFLLLPLCFFFVCFFVNSQWPSVCGRNKKLAKWTYPIGYGHLRKQTKTSYTDTELVEAGARGEAAGWFMTMYQRERKKNSNDIISSVKCGELLTDRAIISPIPSLTKAQGKTAVSARS